MKITQLSKYSIKIELIHRKFQFYTAYSTSEIPIIDSITLSLYVVPNEFNWTLNLRTETYSVNSKNIFKLFFDVLEHFIVGHSKYQHLKDRTRSLGFWQKL